MSEYTKELNEYYENFLDRSETQLLKYMREMNLTGAEKVSIMSQIMIGAMSNSIQASATKSQIEANQVKIEQEKRLVRFKLDAARSDMNIKRYKEFQEEQRSGGASFNYTFYKSYFDEAGVLTETDLIEETEIDVGQTTYPLFNDYRRIATKTINEGTTKSIVELQQDKAIADINYVDTQRTQLVISVLSNNKARSLSAIAEILGSMMVGGLVPPEDGFEFVFTLASQLASIENDINFDVFKELARVEVDAATSAGSATFG